jgi:hypothetical protein
VRRRSGYRSGLALASVFLWFVLADPGLAASLPPRYRFRTLQSGRIKVHFHAEVEKPARRTLALVLEILPRLEERYRVRVPSLDMVVHDASDSPNGLASSFPYPYVEIRTASPDGADSGPSESWLRLVITHELAHIVHIEQAGGIYALGRRLFGRAPFLFPDALQPTWLIEGLAVREETKGTAFGRGRHTFTKMVVDEAARSGQLERMDQATLGLDAWPLGNAPYLFGQEFLNFVEMTYQEGTTRDLALAHAASFRPYLDDKTFRQVTGRGLAQLWREFARTRLAGLAHAAVLSEGPGAQLLTTRGVVQTAPRLSPDGSLLAYTSRTLDRLGEIRLMNKDGSSDRRLTSRVSGAALAWSPDGKFIVFDEAHPVRKFEWRLDLFQVEVSTGRRRRMTEGARASDPDYGPGVGAGDAPIVFVRRLSDRSELCLLSGGEIQKLTASLPGTEWSHPRFSPRGDAVVASRLMGGFSDLVLVDPLTGATENLTRDRALDGEPSWVDDRTLIFRSDREAGSFRLFLLNRDGSGLRGLGASPENAFAPEVDRATSTVFYARYSAKGYDLARARFAEGEAVGVFVDPFPANQDEAAVFEGSARPYRSWPSLRPTFVTPYVAVVSDEWRFGLATAASDPLFRTAYGVAGSWGTNASRPNLLGYLRYGRFTPTFTALVRTESSPERLGRRDQAEALVSADFPLERKTLRSQALALTLRRRREEISRGALDSGIIALTWQLDSTQTYPMSISRQDGLRLGVAITRELKALGSDLDFGKVIVDARAYKRFGPTVVASRIGLGWTFGPRAPERAFAVGGLPSPGLLDPVGDAPAVLRGYEQPDGTDESRFGTRLAFGNLEWRIPLGHPQRGAGTFPLFLRHMRLSASLDGAVISTAPLNFSSARIGASLGLGADLLLGHRIPLTLEGGVGFGLTRDGSIVPWFSLGLPF